VTPSSSARSMRLGSWWCNARRVSAAVANNVLAPAKSPAR
jgi:hypothetical protein